MKQQNMLMTGAAALVALAAVGAIAASSYAASTTDATASNDTVPVWGMMHGRWDNLTDVQKAELEAQRTERQATMEAERNAIDAAMAQGYDAWVAAVKKYHGENAPILDEVTAEKFTKFAEAHGYMTKAKAIFEEIGVDRSGMGMGKGMGHGRGHGMGMYGPKLDQNTATDTQ